jgi:hypothetical protein
MMRSGEIPEAEWAKLMALQQRHSQLEALLPSGMNDFADLDAGQLDAKLADNRNAGRQCRRAGDPRRTGTAHMKEPRMQSRVLASAARALRPTRPESGSNFRALAAPP